MGGQVNHRLTLSTTDLGKSSLMFYAIDGAADGRGIYWWQFHRSVRTWPGTIVRHGTGTLTEGFLPIPTIDEKGKIEKPRFHTLCELVNTLSRFHWKQGIPKEDLVIYWHVHTRARNPASMLRYDWILDWILTLA
jgi:hypothetical protein